MGQYNLKRFLDAQSSIYAQAHSELRDGRKRTHWMWFIFPQIRGLGSSDTARHFSIGSIEEAAAYLQHPILGPRLRDCTSLVNAVPSATISDIFPYPDDLKFHSSVTLFHEAATHSHADPAPFTTALNKFFAGRPDQATLDLLESSRPTHTPACTLSPCTCADTSPS